MSYPHVSYMHSGMAFDFSDPKPEMIDLDDIARGLDEKRFRNQLDTPWTIYQHSILVAIMVPQWRSEALMHDGSEAYTGDLPGPFKKLLGESYKKFERPIEKAIADRFGLTYPWPKAIKEADMLVQDIEASLFHPFGSPIVTDGFSLETGHRKLVDHILTLTKDDFIDIFEASLLERIHGKGLNALATADRYDLRV